MNKSKENKSKEKRFFNFKKNGVINKWVVIFVLVVVSVGLVFSKTIGLKGLFQNNLSNTVNSVSNPSYTIQHYVYFPEVSTGNSGTTLPFINTSDTDFGEEVTTHNKGNLNIPNGNTSLDNFNVELTNEDTLGGNLKFKTHNKLIKFFEDQDTFYRIKPQINYMNNFCTGNNHYALTEVWVYEPGEGGAKNKEDLTDDDFVKYQVPKKEDGVSTDASQIRFTNNPVNSHITTAEQLKDENYSGYTENYPYKYTILIKQNTVVRLCFAPTIDRIYHKNADFFDYDVTDGNIYDSPSTANPRGTSNQTNNDTWYANTTRAGINSDTNYTTGGVRYGFGNANIYNSYEGNLWKGNALNRSNNRSYGNSFKGCTFGMVPEMTYSEGNKAIPVFDSGIAAPDIFSEKEVPGKTPYTNGEYTIGFHRRGNTFTLDSIRNNTKSENTLENLKEFQLTYNVGSTQIYSNEFWPMDSSDSYGTDGHDLKFGSKTYQDYRRLISNQQQFPLSDSSSGTGIKDADHNSFFGMAFNVTISIAPGYRAPLNYWFYGDDDLWVFLEKLDKSGNPIGKAKLIADIGGIHSAVGEYVNLWEYIEPVDYYDKDGNMNESQKYRLNIFYTERGASGSNCYMRFDAPLEDINVNKNDVTRELVVEKEVSNSAKTATKFEDNFEKFDFLVELDDERGTKDENMYEYEIYQRDTSDKNKTTLLKTDVLEVDDKTGLYKFSLQDGQYIVIYGLSENTSYIVKEADSSEYLTYYQLGNHNYVGDQFVSDLEGTQYYNYTTANNKQVMKNHNYVKFTNNEKATKNVIVPGNGVVTHVGDEIIYGINWGNDTNKVSTVTITDKLDDYLLFSGANFVGVNDAWFGAEAKYEDDNIIINFDKQTNTLTSTIKNAAVDAGGTLYVRANVVDKDNKSASGKLKITNKANIKIGDTSFDTLEVENGVYIPRKIVVTPGEGVTVKNKDRITYRVSWENYLDDTANVVIRDTLVDGVDYVSSLSKVSYSTGSDVPNATVKFDEESRELVFSLGEQNAKAEGYVTFTVEVTKKAPDVITNRASLDIGDSRINTNEVKNPVHKNILTGGGVLPTTGGKGTLSYSVIGLVLFIIGLAMFVVVKKMRFRKAGPKMDREII